jgi:predicted dehydrogenase
VRILQIGLGGFGKNHLKAWNQLGLGRDLYVAEVRKEAAISECSKYNMAPEQVSAHYRDFLPRADVVDIVTPTDSHYTLCLEALQAGKDVFVEKPITLTSGEAEELAQVVRSKKSVLQVGYYYRFHPASRWIKETIRSGLLGQLRYLSGNFAGFKRARTDVGVTHTDGIHFLDLFNWFVGQPPKEVWAVTRDHFNRGLEDFSIVICTYAGGEIAKVESGYIQPGKWVDKVVPSAWTSKEIFIVGSQATLEADFETGEVKVHHVRHELRDRIWTAVHGGSSLPCVPAAGPIEQLCEELQAFLASVKTRQEPLANVMDSGFCLARLMEAIYRSSQQKKALEVDYRVTL